MKVQLNLNTTIEDLSLRSGINQISFMIVRLGEFGQASLQVFGIPFRIGLNCSPKSTKTSQIERNPNLALWKETPTK